MCTSSRGPCAGAGAAAAGVQAPGSAARGPGAPEAVAAAPPLDGAVGPRNAAWRRPGQQDTSQAPSRPGPTARPALLAPLPAPRLKGTRCSRGRTERRGSEGLRAPREPQLRSRGLHHRGSGPGGGGVEGCAPWGDPGGNTRVSGGRGARAGGGARGQGALHPRARGRGPFGG